MKSTTTILCGTLLIATGMGPAVAGTVTWKLTGRVTGIFAPLGPVLGGQLEQDQPFTATLAYDPATEKEVGDSEWGNYVPSAALGASTRVSVGPFTFESRATSQFSAHVVNPAAPGISEHFTFSSILNKALPSGASVSSISLSLFDSDGTVFNSEALPAIAFDFQAFGHRELHVEGGGNSMHFWITLHIETAELVPPEMDISPASGSLLPQQNFDAAVLLPADAIPSSLQVSVSGTVLPLSLAGACQVLPPNSTGHRGILCPDAHAALASFSGNTTLDWQVTFANGAIAKKSVEWNLVP